MELSELKNVFLGPVIISELIELLNLEGFFTFLSMVYPGFVM